MVFNKLARDCQIISLAQANSCRAASRSHVFSFYIFFSVTFVGKSFSGVKILDNTTSKQSMKTENEN